MCPGSVCSVCLVEGLGDLAHRARDAQLLAVGGGNAGALLAAMLERVEAEVGEIGGLRDGRRCRRHRTRL